MFNAHSAIRIISGQKDTSVYMSHVSAHFALLGSEKVESGRKRKEKERQQDNNITFKEKMILVRSSVEQCTVGDIHFLDYC